MQNEAAHVGRNSTVVCCVSLQCGATAKCCGVRLWLNVVHQAVGQTQRKNSKGKELHVLATHALFSRIIKKVFPLIMNM